MALADKGEAMGPWPFLPKNLQKYQTFNKFLKSGGCINSGSANVSWMEINLLWEVKSTHLNFVCVERTQVNQHKSYSSCSVCIQAFIIFYCILILYFQVKVAPDLQRVNVFWVCKGTNTDEETESVLCRIAGALRHELSTLRLIGEVPYIVFVKGEKIVSCFLVTPTTPITHKRCNINLVSVSYTCKHMLIE